MPQKLLICLFITLACFSSLEASPIEYVRSSNLSEPPFDPIDFGKSYKKLSSAERWKIKMNGLRFSALDPVVWGHLKVDTTENKNLVSIRPFYLRDSEKRGFKLTKARLRFAYKYRAHRQISLQPQTNASMLDIEIGGKYIPSVPPAPPAHDTAYVLRLSALPGIRSGLFFRNGINYSLVKRGKKKNIKTGKDYTLDLHIAGEEFTATLNGREILSYFKEKFGYGLFSLQSGWNPIYLSELQLKGTVDSSVVHYSGLLQVDDKK